MKKQQGLSLIEMTLVIIVVAIMFIEGAKNLSNNIAEAERATVDATIGALRSALVIEYSRLIVSGQSQHIASLVAKNPFELLQGRPVNYRGEVTKDSQLTQKQAWAFNRNTHEIIYRIKNQKSFKTHDKLLHFKLILGQNGNNHVPNISLWTLKAKIKPQP